MDWKNVVATVAPWLGTALGGPLGGLAVGAVADALGLSEKTEGAIKQALSGATPEQMLAMKTADLSFAVEMQRLGFENVKALEAVAAGDRASARDRETEVKDSTPRVLAYAITIGYFGMLVFIMLASIPNDSRDILNYMLGTLGTAWIAAVTYYFGSTVGSSEKNRLLASKPEK